MVRRDATDSFDMVDPIYHSKDDVMEGEGDGGESTKITSRWFLELNLLSLLLHMNTSRTRWWSRRSEE